MVVPCCQQRQFVWLTVPSIGVANNLSPDGPPNSEEGTSPCRKLGNYIAIRAIQYRANLTIYGLVITHYETSSPIYTSPTQCCSVLTMEYHHITARLELRFLFVCEKLQIGHTCGVTLQVPSTNKSYNADNCWDARCKSSSAFWSQL